MGYPPLVTPTSQIVGSQAVLNVVRGERYKQVSKETRAVVLGQYGQTPAPIPDDVRKKIAPDAKPDHRPPRRRHSSPNSTRRKPRSARSPTPTKTSSRTSSSRPSPASSSNGAKPAPPSSPKSSPPSPPRSQQDHRHAAPPAHDGTAARHVKTPGRWRAASELLRG